MLFSGHLVVGRAVAFVAAEMTAVPLDDARLWYVSRQPAGKITNRTQRRQKRVTAAAGSQTG